MAEATQVSWRSKIPGDTTRSGGLWNAIRTGLVAGVFFSLLLVFVETAFLTVLWWGSVIAPQPLTETRMFNFLTELYAALQNSADPTWMPAPLSSVYGPDLFDSLFLGRDLLLVTLPMGALAGIVAGWVLEVSGKSCTAGRVVGILAAVGFAAELIGWIASVQLPVRYSLGSVVTLAVRNFIWDGALVSCFVLALCATLCFAASLRLRLEENSRSRSAVLFLLFCTLTWTVSAAVSEVPRGHASLPPSKGQTHPLDPDLSRPNVLLISIDSLRADRLGCYGNPRDTSPRIDTLARRGVLFTNAWSTTSWTLPAHVSLLSGRSLLGHGVREARRIPASVPMLAETLHGIGYQTAAFVSAPWLSSRFGFDRGFDLYDDFSVPFTPDRESRMRAQATLSAPLLAPAIERWLRQAAKPPFFLFLHYFDVHYDYSPPAPYNTMFDPSYDGPITGRRFHADPRIRPDMAKRDLDHLLALYDGEIRFTDDHIGRVLDLMEELGFLKSTFIVLTADHGDEFFEHGGKGHHRTLYEEVLRVPLILSWPGRLAQGLRVEEPVSIVDALPTILAVLGQAPPKGTEGINLLSAATGRGPLPARTLVSELYVKQNINLQVAVRKGNIKLIESLNFPGQEFYDLARDPGETKPGGGADRSTLARDLGQWMRETWKGPEQSGADPGKVSLDPGRMEALRALGYLE